MCRELVVAPLNVGKALRGFASGHRDESGLKSATLKTGDGFGGKAPGDVGVRDDSATGAEFQAATFLAETWQKLRGDLDLITALAQGDFDGAHLSSIRIGAGESKRGIDVSPSGGPEFSHLL